MVFRFMAANRRFNINGHKKMMKDIDALKHVSLYNLDGVYATELL